MGDALYNCSHYFVIVFYISFLRDCFSFFASRLFFYFFALRLFCSSFRDCFACRFAIVYLCFRFFLSFAKIRCFRQFYKSAFPFSLKWAFRIAALLLPTTAANSSSEASEMRFTVRKWWRRASFVFGPMPLMSSSSLCRACFDRLSRWKFILHAIGLQIDASIIWRT